jgi:nucleoside-diphosphate-sugar epimerase
MADQRYYVSDTSTFGAGTGWKPRMAVQRGIENLYEWLGDVAGTRADALAAAAGS